MNEWATSPLVIVFYLFEMERPQDYSLLKSSFFKWTITKSIEQWLISLFWHLSVADKSLNSWFMNLQLQEFYWHLAETRHVCFYSAYTTGTVIPNKITKSRVILPAVSKTTLITLKVIGLQFVNEWWFPKIVTDMEHQSEPSESCLPDNDVQSWEENSLLLNLVCAWNEFN